MRVVALTPISGEIVEIDNSHNTFIRYASDSWEESYGMSMECVSFPEKLEAAYQKFLVDTAT